jgi:hypothetical protein
MNEELTRMQKLENAINHYGWWGWSKSEWSGDPVRKWQRELDYLNRRAFHRRAKRRARKRDRRG